MTMSMPRTQRGQSMLEAIIATGIIVTAVSSALTLVASSIRASKESETSIVASNLAREGVEVVRAIRDTNWLRRDAGQAVAFESGFYGAVDASDYSAIAIFDPAANVWTLNYEADEVEDSDAARIYMRTTTEDLFRAGSLLQLAAAPADDAPYRATPYSRFIRTLPICDENGSLVTLEEGELCPSGPQVGLDVTSTVRWNATGARTREVVAQEILMDWR